MSNLRFLSLLRDVLGVHNFSSFKWKLLQGSFEGAAETIFSVAFFEGACHYEKYSSPEESKVAKA